MHRRSRVFERLNSAKSLKIIPAEPEQDRLEQYTSTDPVPFQEKQHTDVEFDVLGYWMDRRLMWPQLSKLAFDTFADTIDEG